MSDEPDQIVPATQEEIDAYAQQVEEAYLTDEERQLALQAQMDLAEGKRQVAEAQQVKIKALLRTFKGVHSRRDITTLASIGLRRIAAIHNAELERQRNEHS